ncbi:MAG: hypothetical protein KDA37_12985 [Planctomycetales bacterium]|nr:hypothetical protein [Planctomycetales bacterium]
MFSIRHLNACCAVAILVCALGAGGCASRTEWVTLRETPSNPFATRVDMLRMRGPRPSPRTEQLLRQFDLLDQLNGDRSALISRLNELTTPATRAEHQYAAAELAYLGAHQAHRSDASKATELYGTALLNAHDYLFSEHEGVSPNAYDPQFRGACDLYNQSLEGLLRLVSADGQLRPGDRRTLKTSSHDCQFDVVLHSTGWHNEDVDRFEFVSDYQINGLRNHFHSYGLGVPLIAVRRRHDSEDPAEQYLPDQLAFPITALLRVDMAPAGHSGIRRVNHVDAPPAPSCPKFVLDMHDPLDRQNVQLHDHRVPLESDLSTPLAYFLNQPALREETISTLGLLRPDSVKQLQGLYMLEPYNPHKMPVLMVHGLWSSPATWMEMFNDLRSDPNVRSRYQFWFYLYPSGQPFWNSAAQLREELAVMRQNLDPKHRTPALDQMVLVGHSMGGLVSRMQSIDSQNLFWAENSAHPFADIEADDDTRRLLAETYFFKPNPSVRRVVTIGSPHRGSEFANGFTTWLGRKLIEAPMRVMRGRAELLAHNPGYFLPGSPVTVRNSIESLKPESSILRPLLAARPGPWVSYHNIIGRAPDTGIRKVFSLEGDGVVSLASARLDDLPQVESQLVVNSDHLTVHRHPQSILEVRRVLLEQLVELETLPYGSKVQLAGEDGDSTQVRMATAAEQR